jgi:hypothetical protein
MGEENSVSSAARQRIGKELPSRVEDRSSVDKSQNDS